MSLLSHIVNENINTLNINMSRDVNFYLIRTNNGSTYNYTLPAITCDGQQYTLVRDDKTTAIVNLIGDLNINDTLVSTFNISSYVTIVVVSLGTRWYLIHAGVAAQTGNNNTLSSFYLNNNTSPYITIPSGSVFLVFPFLGTSSGAIINAVSFDIVQTINTDICSINFLDPLGNILFTLTYTDGLPGIQFLSSSQKANLPSAATAISIQSITVAGTDPKIASLIIF